MYLYIYERGSKTYKSNMAMLAFFFFQLDIIIIVVVVLIPYSVISLCLYSGLSKIFHHIFWTTQSFLYFNFVLISLYLVSLTLDFS